jgi:hypothetical protein
MEEGMKEQHVAVELKTGFVLYGIIVDKTDAGIWLKTNQMTSFNNYDTIANIKKDRRYL